jgi:autotransporter-associated beta strand protein
VNLTLGRLGGTYAPPFTTASNKTLQMAAFSMSGPLVVTNNHGFGLVLTGAATLGSNQIISVTNVPAGPSASNVVQGLTFSGAVSGSSGITKLGNGTLALTGSNSFTGLIDIQGGVVAVNSDSALGNASNQVRLNVNAATGAGLRATGTFATSRTIQLNRASNAIEVTAGNTLTLNTAFSLGAANNALRLNDNGMLVLAAANTTWTGGFTVGSGVARVTNASALGTTAGATTVTASPSRSP